VLGNYVYFDRGGERLSLAAMYAEGYQIRLV